MLFTSRYSSVRKTEIRDREKKVMASSAPDEDRPAKKVTVAANEEEEEQHGNDFISRMPDNILHMILSKLQTCDTAVTTAVSKRWCPLFLTLPSLEIDEASFNPRDLRDDLGVDDDHVFDRNNWIDALFSVLESRITPVKRFGIAVDTLEPDEDEFYDVFRCLCVSGVEELSIMDTELWCCYRIPSPVFACNTITKLELCSCKLVGPSKLTGLRSVKMLKLTQVTVADDHLRRMISRCKAMERLHIFSCRKIKNVVIRAPSLSELVIDFGQPIGVLLKSAPLLASISVSFEYDIKLWKEFDACFEELTDAEECLGGFDRSRLGKAFGESNEATDLIAFLNGLRNVEDLHLIFCNEYHKVSTCLKEYKYGSKDLELDFWEKQPPAECVKHHLRTATFHLEDYAFEDCSIFLKFLLQNAGTLNSMNILIHTGWEPETTAPEATEVIKNKLAAILVASPDVEISVKPSRFMCRHTRY